MATTVRTIGAMNFSIITRLYFLYYMCDNFSHDCYNKFIFGAVVLHMDIAKKGKSWEKNCVPSNSRRKQHRNDKSYQSKTWQNSKYRLCGERDETINHIISECSKLAPKEYETWYNWVGKAIHRELCKKFKYDLNSKWYMHHLESFLENEMHKLP